MLHQEQLAFSCLGDYSSGEVPISTTSVDIPGNSKVILVKDVTNYIIESEREKTGSMLFLFLLLILCVFAVQYEANRTNNLWSLLLMP